MIKKLSSGTAHRLPKDFKDALLSSVEASVTWEDITPLARNEWICWVISVKAEDTRQRHIVRAIEELAEGGRRPCCWMGCMHRKDKVMSLSQKFISGKLK